MAAGYQPPQITRRLYDQAQHYEDWLVVPTLMDNGRFQVLMCDQEGQWISAPHSDRATYDTPQGAVTVGMRAIDLDKTEAEAGM